MNLKNFYSDETVFAGHEGHAEMNTSCSTEKHLMRAIIPLLAGRHYVQKELLLNIVSDHQDAEKHFKNTVPSYLAALN